MENYIINSILKSIEIKNKVLSDKSILELIKTIAQKTIEVYQNNKKILIAGNGGSAADAQHIAGELVSKFYFNRPALSAIALTTDTSILTAIGNDYGFENVFARQIEANGNEGDMFIGISTSGNSKNIIKALEISKNKGLITVGFTGETGGKMKDLCDYCICVPSNETPRIQEAHIMIAHIICGIIEEAIFGKGFKE